MANDDKDKDEDIYQQIRSGKVNMRDYLNAALLKSLSGDRKTGQLDPNTLLMLQAMQGGNREPQGMDPMMLMMIMMNQNNAPRRDSAIDIDKIMEYKIMMPLLDDLAGGKKLDPIQDLMIKKFLSGDDTEKSDFRKFLEYQQHRDEVREAEEKGRRESTSGIDELKSQFSSIEDRLDHPRSMTEQIQDFLALKNIVSEAYKMLSPEQKQVIKAPNEEWTAQDYADAFTSITNAIPNVITAVRGVSSSIKPPKKQVKEEPIKPQAKEPEFSKDVKDYLDPSKWREEEREGKKVWVDPFEHNWESDTGESIKPQDMAEYFRQNPEKASDHVRTTREDLDNYHRQQEEQARREAEAQPHEEPSVQVPPPQKKDKKDEGGAAPAQEQKPPPDDSGAGNERKEQEQVAS